MIASILRFFAAQRHIFGKCPKCEQVFRVSDCNIYSARKPAPDWLDKLSLIREAVMKQEMKFCEAKGEICLAARERGRKQAMREVKKLNYIFAPRKIAPEDAFGIFHPVDYLVFSNQSQGEIRNLLFLDRDNRRKDEIPLQRSIENAVEKQRFEWRTLRVASSGDIQQE